MKGSCLVFVIVPCLSLSVASRCHPSSIVVGYLSVVFRRMLLSIKSHRCPQLVVIQHKLLSVVEVGHESQSIINRCSLAVVRRLLFLKLCVNFDFTTVIKKYLPSKATISKVKISHQNRKYRLQSSSRYKVISKVFAGPFSKLKIN